MWSTKSACPAPRDRGSKLKKCHQHFLITSVLPITKITVFPLNKTGGYYYFSWFSIAGIIRKSIKLISELLVQATNFKKYKSWNPKVRLLISNCFELPSDWLLSYWESQLDGSSKQLLIKSLIQGRVFLDEIWQFL